MFNSSFLVSYIQKKKFDSDDIHAEYNYEFLVYGKKYLVTIEECKYKVYIPKFYPASLKNNKNRCNVLTNDYHAAGIIRTTINIMLEILKNNPGASFSWAGFPVIMKNKKESKLFTQRFRIYKNVMLNFFNQENWYHYEDYRTSTYLLVNKQRAHIDKYMEKVIKMLINIYPDLAT